MFEIATDGPVVKIITKRATVNISSEAGEIDAGLAVGVIRGAGEFEIGEMTIIGIAVGEGVLYTVEDGGIRIGVSGEIEAQLDDMGPIDILATQSVKAIKEVGPKIAVVTANAKMIADEMHVELKYEKRLKIKSETSLPAALEVYQLG